MSEHGSNANKIIDQVCIADEIAKHVKLKPNKNELLGLCPFHNEDTPSFYVNPNKKLFYCFGCQTGGNVITFRAKISGMTASDAIESLSKEYRIALSGEYKDYAPYNDLLLSVNDYYKRALFKNTKALSYLKERGLSNSTIEDFGIGFAPEGWRNLETNLKINISLAKEIGLVIENPKGGYDRFRNRIMFPITSHQGRLVGFGGRAIGDEKPKYINSSDSAVYHKSNILYGLNLALKHNTKKLIIVEGYMDVIRLHQAGFTGAVASLGTAFTTSHFNLAAKYADEIIFCFDGDVAGQKAMHKAFLVILPLIRDQVSCAFLAMPKGEDPDSYISKHSATSFQSLLDNATPFSEYLLTHNSKDIDSLEYRAKQQHYLSNLIKDMPDSVLKKLIHEKIGINYTNTVIKQPKLPAETTNSMHEQFIDLIFSFPQLVEIEKQIIKSQWHVFPLIAQKALSAISIEGLSYAAFLDKHNLNYSKSQSAQHESHTEESAAIELKYFVIHFQIIATDKKITELMNKVSNGDVSQETALVLQKLLKVKHLLKKKQITLARCENS